MRFSSCSKHGIKGPRNEGDNDNGGDDQSFIEFHDCTPFSSLS